MPCRCILTVPPHLAITLLSTPVAVFAARGGLPCAIGWWRKTTWHRDCRNVDEVAGGSLSHLLLRQWHSAPAASLNGWHRRATRRSPLSPFVSSIAHQETTERSLAKSARQKALPAWDCSCPLPKVIQRATGCFQALSTTVWREKRPFCEGLALPGPGGFKRRSRFEAKTGPVGCRGVQLVMPHTLRRFYAGNWPSECGVWRFCGGERPAPRSSAGPAEISALSCALCACVPAARPEWGQVIIGRHTELAPGGRCRHPISTRAHWHHEHL